MARAWRRGELGDNPNRGPAQRSDSGAESGAKRCGPAADHTPPAHTQSATAASTLNALAIHAPTKPLNSRNIPAEEAGKVETVMRLDVFHSTLDWQTRGELRRGARKAWRLLNEQREDYEEYFRQCRASLVLLC